jgi:ABC-2 type transport system permease protein
MIAAIARKEFMELLRDGRFRWTAAIVPALLAVALIAGAYYQCDLIAQQRMAQAAEHARWYAQEPKNPHSAAHYGLYAFKPRLAPAFLDPGVEPYTGVAVWLEAHKQNEMLYRPGEDATLAQRFGDLTVALVLQVVLPLVVVLLAFNAFAGERERGTLRQLLSLGLQPRDLVLGKTLGLGGALALIVAPAVALGAATLAFTGPAEGAARFALLALVYLLYFGIFLLVTLAVSARAPSSRFALVVLLGFWGLNCLIGPRGLADVAASLHPLPEPVSFKARLQAALGDPEGGVSALLQARTAELLTQYGVARAQDLPVNLAGISLQVGEEHGYEIFEHFYGELYSPMEAQNRLLQRSAALLPLLGVQSLSMGLAGTDLSQHRDFTRAAEAHRRAEIKIINDDILAHPVKGGEVHLGDRDLWAKVPEFRYEPPGVGWVMAEHSTALALIFAWFAIAAWFAWRSAALLRPL